MSLIPYSHAMEQTNVFIIRIWYEHREIEGAPTIWRGIIEHIPTSERRYVQEFNEILDFIRQHILLNKQREPDSV